MRRCYGRSLALLNMDEGEGSVTGPKLHAATKFAVLTAAIAVALVTSALAMSSTKPRAHAATSVTTIKVEANQAWTDTGIALASGESVAIKATGTISVCTGVGCSFEATGEKLTPVCLGIQYEGFKGKFFSAPGQHCFSLVGRVGTSGPIFPVAKAFSFKLPVSGELYLGVNDDEYEDNAGSFSATVTTK
jgi:hypothetical protein